MPNVAFGVGKQASSYTAVAVEMGDLWGYIR